MTLSWGVAMSQWDLKVDGTKSKGVGGGRAGLERGWNQVCCEPDQEPQALPGPASPSLCLSCSGWARRFVHIGGSGPSALPRPGGGVPYQKMKPREQNHQEGGWGQESPSVHNSVNPAAIRGHWNLIQSSPLCS